MRTPPRGGARGYRRDNRHLVEKVPWFLKVFNYVGDELI